MKKFLLLIMCMFLGASFVHAYTIDFNQNTINESITDKNVNNIYEEILLDTNSNSYTLSFKNVNEDFIFDLISPRMACSSVNDNYSLTFTSLGAVNNTYIIQNANTITQNDFLIMISPTTKDEDIILKVTKSNCSLGSYPIVYMNRITYDNFGIKDVWNLIFTNAVNFIEINYSIVKIAIITLVVILTIAVLILPIKIIFLFVDLSINIRKQKRKFMKVLRGENDNYKKNGSED